MTNERIWVLLAKKLNKEISPKEESELEMLCQNADYSDLVKLINQLYTLKIEDGADEASKQRSIDAILKAVNLKTYPADELVEDQEKIIHLPFWRKKSFRIAVAAAACTGLVIFWNVNSQNKPVHTETALVNTVKTDKFSKETIYLPDGSTVLLNSGSKINYNKKFGEKTREITLYGEAFFSVTKNPKMPLVVHAGNVDIWVKGTTFNVKAYENDSTTEASLLTGIIELVPHKNPEKKILMHPNEKAVINNYKISEKTAPANTGAVIDKDEAIAIIPLVPAPDNKSLEELEWVKTKMVFKSESFEHLAKDLEIRYGVEINFLDPSLKQLVFTGSFTRETIHDAMEALKSSTPFSYKIEDNKISINK